MKKAIVLIAIAAGCSAPAFAPSSKIDTVRILAMSSDKPYAMPGDVVNMSVLAFDGRLVRSSPMTVSWLPSACINPSGDAYYGCFPALSRVLSPNVDLGPALARGTNFSFQMPADVITSHPASSGREPYGLAVVFAFACAGQVKYVPPPPDSSPDAVPFGCFDGSGKRLGADDFVFAYSLVYSFTARSNSNPVIQNVTFSGSPIDPTVGISVDHCPKSNIDDCTTAQLDVIVAPSSQEADPSNLDANGNILKEEIYVDYYLTAGKVKNDTVVLLDARAGRLSGTSDDLTAPQAPGNYRLWAVLHDNRGGATWQDIQLHAR